MSESLNFLFFSPKFIGQNWHFFSLGGPISKPGMSESLNFLVIPIPIPPLVIPIPIPIPPSKILVIPVPIPIPLKSSYAIFRLYNV